MSRCKGPHCGAEVLWVMGPNRRMMILDPLPVPPDAAMPGNVVMTGERVQTARGYAPLVRVLAANYQPALGEVLPDERYLDHHVTCPDRASFDNPRRARG